MFLVALRYYILSHAGYDNDFTLSPRAQRYSRNGLHFPIVYEDSSDDDLESVEDIERRWWESGIDVEEEVRK